MLLMSTGLATGQSGCYGYQVTGSVYGGEVAWQFGPPINPPEACYPVNLYTALQSNVPSIGQGLGSWTIPTSTSGGGPYTTAGTADWSYEGTIVSVTGAWEAHCFAIGTSFAYGTCPYYAFYMDQLEPEAFTWSLQTGCTAGTQRLVLTDLTSDAGNLVTFDNAAGVNYQLKLNSTVIATPVQRAFTEAVAVAELVPDHADATVGHLGIVVRDDWQGLGLGTALIRELLHHAPALGLATIRADLLAENDGARRLLAPLDFPRTSATRYGETQVLLRLPSAA